VVLPFLIVKLIFASRQHFKMGLECFSIVLNPNPNPSGVYLPGQVVSGYVEIWNKHPKTFNDLKFFLFYLF